MFKRLLMITLPVFLGSSLATAQLAPPPPSTSPPLGVARPTSQPAEKTFSQEELESLLAPIALYPDSLLTQTLMASTYAVEVVQAQRWADANKQLKGDALATALEKQPWDASVKSLVNFPDVLTMMSQKLDWTVQVGNAFLAQQKEVMDTIQKLRGKAQAAGSLKTTDQQKVTYDNGGGGQTIIIESAQPNVVYVPTYDPTVVYGTWPYPAYPPYYYYPPYYTHQPGIYFGAGLALGVAWGYAWGHSDWNHSDIDIDIDRNTNINTRIDRDKYKNDFNRNNSSAGGRSEWKHDPAHRGNTPYPNRATNQQFGRQAAPTRDSYRGYNNQSLGQPRVSNGTGSNFGTPANSNFNRANTGGNVANRAGSGSVNRPQANTGMRSGAYQGVNQGAAQTRAQSARGRASSGGGARAGGGGGRRR